MIFDQPSSDLISSILYDTIDVYFKTKFSHNIVSYAVKGGKRTRGRMYLESLYACIEYFLISGHIPDQKTARTIARKFTPACAVVELIHEASLIIDDCPFMDNSELRRERDSCFVKFGVAECQLVSLEIILKAGAILKDIVGENFEVVKRFNKMGQQFGINAESIVADGISIGQIMDIRLNKITDRSVVGDTAFSDLLVPPPTSKDDELLPRFDYKILVQECAPSTSVNLSINSSLLSTYLKMVELKTSKLFTISTCLPIMLTTCSTYLIGVEEKNINELILHNYTLSNFFGIAFQLIDDVEDEFHSDEEIPANNLNYYLNRNESTELITGIIERCFCTDKESMRFIPYKFKRVMEHKLETALTSHCDN